MAVNINYTPEKTGETRTWKKGRVVYITFPALDQFSDDLVNAFSTRKTGFSKGIYKSMNLGYDNGDSKENVLFNYMEFSKAIGISNKSFLISNQQHTDHIMIATEEDRGRGVWKEGIPEAVDGFITNAPGVALCIQAADCVPVYLYDPRKAAIGLIHSGWKGTKAGISGKAVSMMQKEYGSDPADMIACIGPSICKDCYEVGRDLYEAMGEVYSEEEMAEIFSPGKEAEKFQLDLWKAIEFTLLQKGIAPSNIHKTDICTCQNPDLMFSRRYTGGNRGNMAAVLMMKPEPSDRVELFKNLLPVFKRRE